MKELLPRLRAMSLYYQTAHWQVKSAAFNADHLLFERLYGPTSERIDQVAEKMVGLTDRSSVNLNNHIIEVHKMVSSLPTECPDNALFFQTELKLEQDLLAYCKACDSDPSASVGIRNMLGDIADEAEGRVYLIKQRLNK